MSKYSSRSKNLHQFNWEPKKSALSYYLSISPKKGSESSDRLRGSSTLEEKIKGVVFSGSEITLAP